jgi:hypothetical protein
MIPELPPSEPPEVDPPELELLDAVPLELPPELELLAVPPSALRAAPSEYSSSPVRAPHATSTLAHKATPRLRRRLIVS